MERVRTLTPTRRPTALSRALRVIREELEDRPAGSSKPTVGSGEDLSGVEIRSDLLRLKRLPGISVRVANSLRDRRRAWRLAYEVYLEKGYAAPRPDRCWYGRHDALPETVTFLAEERGRAVAAVTVVFDSSWSLPAEETAGPELESLRKHGRRPCELVSLVSLKQGQTGAEIVKHLFKLAWIAARHGCEATDLVITVNPRHASYYTRVLQFEQMGSTRPCPRVEGAPATFLRLDLVDAEERYAKRFAALPGRRNLYRFFTERVEDIRAWIRHNHSPLSLDDLNEAFHYRRRLLSTGQLRMLAATA